MVKIMKEKEMIDKMQQNLVIPDIVQKRADDAFKKIRQEDNKIVRINAHKRKWKTMWIVVAAAVLALGTTVCAAAYIRWSNGLEAEFQMTPEERKLLEEQEYLSPIIDNTKEQTESSVMTGSVTAEGITVTPLEMIVDNRFAWLSFRVDGYDLEEGKEPFFNVANIVIDDDPEAIISYFSSFYDGLCYDGNGFYYEDGTSALDENGNLVEKYVNEEGYMEYIIEISGTNYEKGLTDSSLHVILGDLGTVYKAEFTEDIKASWEFDIDLKGSDKVRKVILSEPLGESGATVLYAEISPISLHVEYDFPLQKEAVEAIDENGEIVMTSSFVEAPDLLGVRLKDGTLLLQLMNGGSCGYPDENEDIYVISYATDRVIDPAQVDALLFKKSEPEVNEQMRYQWKEENLYIVPIE